MAEKKRIIFLCTGNSCRSPMAEGIAKKIFKMKGLDFAFESFGTIDLGGSPPAFEAQKICRNHDIDISTHRSQVLTRQSASRADVILVMENAHKEWIAANIGDEALQKTYLLTQYGCHRKNSQEIPDPIGMPEHFYLSIFRLLWREIERIANYEMRNAE